MSGARVASAGSADCGPDEACLRPEHGLGAGIALPQCVRTPEDACRSDALCGDGFDICSPQGASWDYACSHCRCD